MILKVPFATQMFYKIKYFKDPFATFCIHVLPQKSIYEHLELTSITANKHSCCFSSQKCKENRHTKPYNHTQYVENVDVKSW